MSEGGGDHPEGSEIEHDEDQHPLQSPAQQLNGHRSQEPPNNETESHRSEMANGRPTTQLHSTQGQQQNGSADHQAPSSEQIPAPEETPIDPKQSLEPFGWEDLEQRFLEKMEDCQRREDEIEEEFSEWCQVGFPIVSNPLRHSLRIACQCLQAPAGQPLVVIAALPDGFLG